MFRGFESLKIQGKLLVVFGSIIMIGVMITGWTVIAINSLDSLARNLYQANSELNAALQSRNMAKEVEISMTGYVLTGDEFFHHENFSK